MALEEEEMPLSLEVIVELPTLEMAHSRMNFPVVPEMSHAIEILRG